MVRALLIKHGTRNPGCRLSPYEVLAYHNLRGILPFIMSPFFTNTQISDEWSRAWQMKEESLKVWYIKSPCKLLLLQVGGQLMIQNQTGQFLSRCDRSGVIVSFLGSD